MMDKKFHNIDLKLLEKTIAEAEKHTSGEIRVHIESRCPGDVLQRAIYWFNKLGMQKTKERNGVLIYLAFKDHKFAIIGDEGIYNKTGQNFWDETKQQMLEFFKKGELTQGLMAGIKSAGEKLKTFFPYDPGSDINELSDEISTHLNE